MNMEIAVASYTLQLTIQPYDAFSSIVVRLPDGVEATCTYQAGLAVLLEGLCGKRWWQHHRDEVVGQLAQRGLTIE
jgi:hypothetical protein